ncbi:MAG: hypothetical protein NTV22_02345, partial [bacterium]|nr:hypothetical protein [bacterium]
MLVHILTFIALLVTASAAAVECLDADFECARVPAQSGAALWAPPADYGGWQFSASAGVVNTAADGWRGPRADDGTQIAGLRGAQADIA